MYGINQSIRNNLLKLVMTIGSFYNLHFTLPRHCLVQIHHRKFNAPQTQIPPPLVIALEVHDRVNQSELIRNVVIVHLGVLFVQQVDTKKLVVQFLFQQMTVHELLVLDPCCLFCTVQQNVEGLLIEAR